MHQYLDPSGADVWFVFDRNLIPAHQSKLVISEWFETMFEPSLVDNVVDMTNEDIKIEDFKEFLKFFYDKKPSLHLKNIEGVINLAKRSSVVKFFDLCETFLINTIYTNKHQTFFVHHLASRCDVIRLKIICEFEIAMNTEELLQMPSFLKLPYETLQSFLQCNTFGCDEKLIFSALLEWAKAACVRKNQDPKDVKNWRNQLKELVHQIRFKSMKTRDFAACLEMSSDLFFREEIIEILYTMDPPRELETTKFSELMRYSKSRYKMIEYSRLLFYFNERYNIEKVERTIIQCKQLVLLREFSCICDQKVSVPVNVIILEKDNLNSFEIFNEQLTLNFRENGNIISTCEARVPLSKPLLLRPPYVYMIEIKFQSDPRSVVPGGLHRNRQLLSKSNFPIALSTMFSFVETIERPETSESLEIGGIISRIWFSHLDVKNTRWENMKKYVHSIVSALFDMLINSQVFFCDTLLSWFSRAIRIFTIGFYRIDNPRTKDIAAWLILIFFWFTMIQSCVRDPLVLLFFIIIWIRMAMNRMNRMNRMNLNN